MKACKGVYHKDLVRWRRHRSHLSITFQAAGLISFVTYQLLRPANPLQRASVASLTATKEHEGDERSQEAMSAPLAISHIDIAP